MARKRARKFYAGFVDGEMPVWTGLGGVKFVEILTNKRVARKMYEDVREVVIREVRSARKGS